MTTADQKTRDAQGRLAGLGPAAIQLVTAGSAALQRQNAAAAEQSLRAALVQAPENAEILRLLAIALRLQNRNAEALDLLRRAVMQRPQDALIQNGLGTALDACGEGDAAIAAFHRACELAPQAAQLWSNLGKTLSDLGRFEEALPVLERAVQLSDHATTHLRLAYALRVLGQTDMAAVRYRELIARNPANGAAWLGLASLKTRPLAAADIATMQAALDSSQLSGDDRISIGFALAKALEDHAQYAPAFAALETANALTRHIRPWDSAAFSALVDAILAAFTPAPAGAASRQGEEVIFIVSLPRAGSSLTEQILASHAQVKGAGELDDMTAVIVAESQRRNMPFPQWVATTGAQDWQRLGQHYLERTQRWHRPGMRFTDKLPGNWLRVGAALAMLPGARVIDCRRDPLETCFSCFRQLFVEGAQPFSYDLADIAAYWRDYDRTSRHWQRQYPRHVRVQSYEALLAAPEQEIADLLAFCGLPFDPACLRYNKTRRSVRTASASQVREPLMRDTARATKYGALLDRLRAALGPGVAQ
ncbi:MAG: sulfotransferase [Rudaea sp.]|nr:sulfotransferase [Rudaea sp.]